MKFRSDFYQPATMPPSADHLAPFRGRLFFAANTKEAGPWGQEAGFTGVSQKRPC